MKRLPILRFQSFCSHFLGQPLLRGGDPKLRVFTSRQSYFTWHCSIINCWARSTLRALLRMAVPPVLSSTSAEYSLQEVKGCTMAQPAWHATVSVGYSGNGMEVHQLLSKANEGCKIKRLREEITDVLSGVHVHCSDKFGVTESLYPLLSCIHVAEPTPARIRGLRSKRLSGSIIHLEYKGSRELDSGFIAHVAESKDVHGGRPHCINLGSC